VITRALPATADGAVEQIPVDGLERFRAAVLGPGLGTATATVTAVREFIGKAPVPIVLDADGINAIAGDPELLAHRPDGVSTIITPHEGEFTRLAGGPPGDDRVAAARDLARRSNAVVLLKGSRSVIAAPDGRAAINTTGGPWLATAGTGDVLAGIVGALVARGLEPFDAAVAGAWLHGRAADGAGHAGLVAGDLIDALPRILASLEE
jgi:NAD(P)H-hydrate epimerase